eukprot:TRINITY_DN4958_c0_g1_i1.p1 TRINITY_DN4958_c0_g1~~TRINITY_DN4958_c0_g1_i1.p1  ORF type:complete len:338 (-),score=73.65 TRINITY_DN4958_c0_g1_i1:168-1181(-)
MGCMQSAEKLGQMRVLLQGIGGCGKSTFAKQMRIIHNAAFSDDERTLFRTALGSNIITGLRYMMSLAEQEGKLEISKKTRALIEDADAFSGNWDRDLVDAARIVWENESIVELRESGWKSDFDEAINWAMENIDKVASPTWVPDEEAILYARLRTTGINETRFVTQGYEWTLIDVGGQAQERRKWTMVQQGLTAMLYFVAADEYDLPSEEDENLSKLDVSLDVWEECIHGEAVSGHLAIILFLNKADLLEKRIQKDNGKTFKKATGSGTVKNAEAANTHLKSMFMNRIRPGTQTNKSQIFVHNTCALDTAQMRVVFESVKDFVVQQRMMSMGLMRGM